MTDTVIVRGNVNVNKLATHDVLNIDKIKSNTPVHKFIKTYIVLKYITTKSVQITLHKTRIHVFTREKKNDGP